jgi:hypothetical protein
MIVRLEVASSPGGPWTQIDQHYPYLSALVQGTFIENNIAFRHTWYRIRFDFSGYCVPWPHIFDGETQPSYICFPSSGTPVPTDTVTTTPTQGSHTPTYTHTHTPVPQSRTATATRTSTPTATPTPRCPGEVFSDVCPEDYFYIPVMYLYDHGAISGYSDGTFRPYNYTTRGQLCKIVVLAEGWQLYNPPSPTFTDVPSGHPFYQYIETAYRQGIISGYSDGTFRPANDVTRGQLCKIVVLAEGWPPVNPPSPTFTDVPVGHPFYGYVETAYDHSIISGYTDGTFRPSNNATRGQISKIVYQAVTGP